MDSGAIIALTFILTFFVFVYSMIRMKHRHELAKLDRIAEDSADRSLTTGELETIIRSIVAETTEPLQDRIDDLTRMVNPSAESMLPDPDRITIDDEQADVPKTVGRRARS